MAAASQFAPRSDDAIHCTRDRILRMVSNFGIDLERRRKNLERRRTASKLPQNFSNLAHSVPQLAFVYLHRIPCVLTLYNLSTSVIYVGSQMIQSQKPQWTKMFPGLQNIARNVSGVDEVLKERRCQWGVI